MVVLLAALGNFVDIYDLILFSLVRVQSLTSIGVPPEKLLDTGLKLINMQMGGMLLGGILWGVMGDKMGRLSVLLGSIALYSLANIANGFVNSVPAYAALRFISGVGLAGELGAGITLVSELMSKEARGYGTMLVAGLGLAGAIAAGLVGNRFGWRNAYFVGGFMGLALLLLRIGICESVMFNKIKDTTARRGNFFMLFSPGKRLLKYLYCIVLGMPTWFIIGILMTFAPEFGKALAMPVLPTATNAVMIFYATCTIGNLANGTLSQLMKSRRKAILIFFAVAAALCVAYFNLRGASLFSFYAVCAGLGFFAAYWAVLLTMAAEQFGTNIRATVSTTVPNFVRSSLVLVSWGFQALKPGFGILTAASIVGAAVFALALFSLSGLGETYGKDLDYVEA